MISSWLGLFQFISLVTFNVVNAYQNISISELTKLGHPSTIVSKISLSKNQISLGDWQRDKLMNDPAEPTIPWELDTKKTFVQPARIAHVKNRRFYDINGRQRYFRGVNVLRKGDPWYPDVHRWHPQYSFNQVDIDLLSDLNINIIRLGVMWPGVEPQRGVYNLTYLEIMKSITRKCQDKGIYVLVEMHQDILSEKFCGEGVPLWAAQPDVSAEKGFPWPMSVPYITNSDGLPESKDCERYWWPKYHNTASIGRAYERIYKNRDGLAEAFGRYMGLLAKEFKSFDNVIGYEIMNEPWAGDVFKNPALLIPGVADRLNLQPFYDVVAEHIREQDPEAIIFFEGVTWDNFAVGFNRVPGGNDYQSKSVLSHHFYHPEPNIFPFPKNMRKRVEDAERLRCGTMLTEFDIGAFYPHDRLLEVLDVSDQYLESWIGWEYKPFYPITGWGESLVDMNSGEVRLRMAKLYSRTFVESVAGHLILMQFEYETGVFKMEYEPFSCGGITDIRLHEKLHYPGGMNISVIPSNDRFQVNWVQNESNANYIHVKAIPKDENCSNNINNATTKVTVLINTSH